jgi:hypothetical protein
MISRKQTATHRPPHEGALGYYGLTGSRHSGDNICSPIKEFLKLYTIESKLDGFFHKKKQQDNYVVGG